MNKEKVFEIVRNVVLEVLPELNTDKIVTGINLKELGANSIDRVEVVMLSMQELGIKIPLMEFAKVKSLGQLVDILALNV